MSNYVPDTWVVIRILGDDPHYRVLGGWSGGYLSGDSWRLNSGIVRVEQSTETFHIGDRTHVAEYFDFYGSSGSVYRCNKEAYGLRNSTYGIWNQLQEKYGDKVEMMEEEIDWLAMDWA